MSDVNEDDLIEIASTCGKAFGFALAAALRSREDFKTNQGMENFGDLLADMSDTEQFSPEVSVVMLGIADGLRTFSRAKPGSGELL